MPSHTEQERKKRKQEKEGQEFVREREKRASRLGGGGRGDTEAAARSIRLEGAPAAAREEKERGGVVRREQFREATGSQQFAQELEQQIVSPRTLEPLPVLETAGEAGTGIKEIVAGIPPTPVKLGLDIITGKFKAKDITEHAKAVAGSFGTAATIGSIFAVPALGRAAIIKVSSAKILGAGGSATALKTAVAGLALFAFGGKILDFRAGEMDVYRAGLKKVVEDGERLEAAVRNGLPPDVGITTLRTMADEVATAERRIQELGNFNVDYRVSKEYILDQQNVRSAREALLRRVLAIENIAATGQAGYSPEDLVVDVIGFDRT